MTLLLAMSLGCTPDNQISRNTYTDVFLQEPASEVDILWVIDNSNSMAEEQERVAQGFESFIENVENTNIDFHLGVVTTDMDLDNPQRGVLVGDTPVLTADDNYVEQFKRMVRVGTDGSDKEKGLSAALEALTEPMVSGPNSGFLRADAILSIVYVSDENDCSDNGALGEADSSACYDQQQKLIPVLDFITGFRGVKGAGGPRVLASAIVGPNVNQGCQDSWPGHRYTALAEGLGGQVGNICDSDYDELMYDLGLAVSGSLDTFQLTYAAIPDSIVLWIDDQDVTQSSSWSYDEEYWFIRFDDGSVPERGTTLSIEYEIAGG